MAPLPQEYFYTFYTFADLLDWDDSTRYELYGGVPVALASPSNIHQEICMALSAQIYNYLSGRNCKVYPAPFDVRLFERQEDTPGDVDTVVQPDISVVCDPKKTDGHGCKGAPDLVMEVSSPSTARYDKLTKYDLYQRAGVREYWIVDPDARTVAVHLLQEGQYGSPDFYTASMTVPVSILEDCAVDLRRVFQS